MATDPGNGNWVRHAKCPWSSFIIRYDGNVKFKCPSSLTDKTFKFVFTFQNVIFLCEKTAIRKVGIKGPSSSVVVA